MILFYLFSASTIYAQEELSRVGFGNDFAGDIQEISVQEISTPKITQRALVFNKLPKIFNWYEKIITSFSTEKSRTGKYIHRIKDLKKKIYWEIERCPQAGLEAKEQANNGLIEMGQRSNFMEFDDIEIIDDFQILLGDIENMITDEAYAEEAASLFEYEYNDELQQPSDLDIFSRGKKQKKSKKTKKKKNKHNRNDEWILTNQNQQQRLEENKETLQTLRPPRVIVYKLNKGIMKWFNLFLPKSCKKFWKLTKRMKGLKKQITNLMPLHTYVDELTFV